MKNQRISVLLILASTWKAFCSTQIPNRLVDLTHVLEPNEPRAPVYPKYKIKVVYSVNYTYRYERITTVTHEGTHTDAPCHLDLHGRKITDLSLKELVAPAAVVDVTSKVKNDRDYQLQIGDLVEWEQKTGRRLNDVIVLMRSGWCKKWSDRKAFLGTTTNDISKLHFPGISPSAARWLVAHRYIYGMGVESVSLDYGQTKNFSTHTTLLYNDKFGIENINCMDDLPLYGATLYVMPMKIGNACGAPTRLIATY